MSGACGFLEQGEYRMLEKHCVDGVSTLCCAKISQCTIALYNKYILTQTLHVNALPPRPTSSNHDCPVQSARSM